MLSLSLQRPSWTTGLIVFITLCPVIWVDLTKCLYQGRGLGQTSARNIVCVLLWLNSLRGDEWGSSFAFLKSYAVVTRGLLLLHGAETQAGLILYPFFCIAGRNLRCTSPLPQIHLGDLFILTIPFYKFKTTVDKKRGKKASISPNNLL